MRHEAARASHEAFGEFRSHDGRGRGGEDGVRGRGLVELGEDAALVLDPLRPVFLHKVDPAAASLSGPATDTRDAASAALSTRL